MNRYKNLTTTNELTIKYPKSKDDSSPHGDSGTFFLEYESDSKVGGDFFSTLDGIHMTMETRNKREKNPTNSMPTQNATTSPSSAIVGASTSSFQRKEKKKFKPIGKPQSSFEIIKYSKDAHIQVSPLNYLKTHPIELQKLVDYCKSDANAKTQPNVNSTISSDQPQSDSVPLDE